MFEAYIISFLDIDYINNILVGVVIDTPGYEGGKKRKERICIGLRAT